VLEFEELEAKLLMAELIIEQPEQNTIMSISKAEIATFLENNNFFILTQKSFPLIIMIIILIT